MRKRHKENNTLGLLAENRESKLEKVIHIVNENDDAHEKEKKETMKDRPRNVRTRNSPST